MNPSDIRGAGGGGGASTPLDAQDTLRSVQRGEIVDLLGEGHIGGLVNGLKSVYLDRVPVENSDGTRNFKDFGFGLSLGGPTDGFEHGMGDISTEVTVNVEVKHAIPVVRSIADPTVDAIRVTLTIPQLAETKDSGDRVGASFEFTIEVQSAGGGFVERHRDTISGKASSTYNRSIKIDLTQCGPAPWDIRLSRVSEDSASAFLLNAFTWSSYTAISGVRMQYKHSAAAWLTFDARNFSAIPERAYDVMGTDDWDIPVNYDALQRTVAGNWNGLFRQGWTNNPAWVFYNLVQHPRYGLGQYVTVLPDKWVLYKLAQWCDEPVPDNRGGTEPRYTINCALMQQAEALKVLQDICAVFRGAILWGGGALSVSWGAPGPPVASYVPANVVDGTFNYSDGAHSAKKSSCTCWYNDRANFGERKAATWDDPDLIAKYGVRPMEIDPLGVATPAQALRHARWALYTQEMEDKSISFRIGADGSCGRVGEIFQVSDPSETGERLGGRVRSATLATVVLDSAVDLLVGEQYTLWVTVADPDDPAKLKLDSRLVTTAPGTTNTLAVLTPFNELPAVGTVWVLEGSNVSPTLWRYMAIKETRGAGGRIEFEVTGQAHEPGKYDFVEAYQPLVRRPTRRLSNNSPKPFGVTITETVYVTGVVPRIRATVTWAFPRGGLAYQVMWRLELGTWQTLQDTMSNTVDIDNLVPGLFEVVVRSLNVTGTLSPPVEANLILGGKATPPANVDAFVYAIKPGQVALTWAMCPDLDYGYTELRVGDTWADGDVLWQGAAREYQHPRPDNGTYQVWACHRDTSGSYSASPAGLAVTVDDSIDPGASAVEVQYSTDGTGVGAGAWHATFVDGDMFGRWKVGGTWNGGLRIVGESGASSVFWFIRADTQPATPPPDVYPPAGYSDEPPPPNGHALWALALALNPDGTLVNGGYPAPVRIDGDNGVRTVSLEMYKWAVAQPTSAFPTGSVTYTWSTGTFTAPATANGWTLLPGAPVSGATLWACSQVLTNNSNSPTSTINFAPGIAYARGAAGTNGTNGINGIGSPGPRGAGAWYSFGNAWNNAQANAACPDGIPVRDDSVTIYNGTTFAEFRRWNGSTWVLPGMVIPGDLLVRGTVTASAMAANTITAASGVIGQAAIGTLLIAGDAVTAPAGSTDTTDYVLSSSWTMVNGVAVYGAAVAPRNVIATASAVLASGGTSGSETIYMTFYQYSFQYGRVDMMAGIPVTVRANEYQMVTLCICDTTPLVASSAYFYRLEFSRANTQPWAVTSLGSTLTVMAARR